MSPSEDQEGFEGVEGEEGEERARFLSSLTGAR